MTLLERLVSGFLEGVRKGPRGFRIYGFLTVCCIQRDNMNTNRRWWWIQIDWIEYYVWNLLRVYTISDFYITILIYLVIKLQIRINDIGRCIFLFIIPIMRIQFPTIQPFKIDHPIEILTCRVKLLLFFLQSPIQILNLFPHVLSWLLMPLFCWIVNAKKWKNDDFFELCSTKLRSLYTSLVGFRFLFVHFYTFLHESLSLLLNTSYTSLGFFPSTRNTFWSILIGSRYNF